MGIGRIGRHLLLNRGRVRRAFSPEALANIERAIEAGEATHPGQVRFAVEGALDGAPLFRDQSARARAIDVFARLRVWDTAHNNGVLIYLLLAEHRIEIVADRGLDRHVSASQWREVMERMRASFRQGEFEAGLNAAIDAVDALLVQHFALAPGQSNPNELPDRPHLR